MAKLPKILKPSPTKESVKARMSIIPQGPKVRNMMDEAIEQNSHGISMFKPTLDNPDVAAI